MANFLDEVGYSGLLHQFELLSMESRWLFCLSIHCQEEKSPDPEMGRCRWEHRDQMWIGDGSHLVNLFGSFVNAGFLEKMYSLNSPETKRFIETYIGILV